jgi:carboxymethylenebutenolidase
MAGKTINITTKTGKGFTGYLATPKETKAPGIILIQEIFGVNSHIKSVADLYAKAGFVVLAPDVFWRVQPGVELGYSPEDVQKGMGLIQKCDQEQILTDLGSAVETLRAQSQCSGKIGAVGYCLGGSLAYRLACHDLVDCAVGYYGGNIEKYLDEAKNLHCPIMLHFGAKDAHITQSTVDKIRTALDGKGHVEIFVYEDADHGFNCDQRKSYDRESTMLAYGRSQVILNKSLK